MVCRCYADHHPHHSAAGDRGHLEARGQYMENDRATLA